MKEEEKGSGKTGALLSVGPCSYWIILLKYSIIAKQIKNICISWVSSG